MSPRARGERTGGAPARAAAPVWVAAAGICAALLLVDPGAEDSFEAPKRAAVLTASLLAAALLALPALLGARPPRPQPPAPAGGSPRGRAAAGLLFGLALAAALLSSAFADDPGAALAAFRTAALFALLLPLGAALPLEAGGGARLLGAALAACALNAALALAQSAGLVRPFAVESLPGRTGAWGLLGNEGLLACVLALGAVASVGAALAARRGAARAAAAAAALLCGAGILATRNLTGLAALSAGLAILLLLRLGRRAAAPLLAATALLAGAALLAPGTRGRLAQAASDARAGRWNEVLSQRFGAWAAAAETVRAHPWLGVGAGGFASSSVPRRLDAELRLRRRLVPPPPATAFAEAHADPLDAAVAAGLPATLALLAAFALLLSALARVARDPGHPARAEAALLAALLGAGAVAALTWFPFQRAAAAAPLLLAAGRAWRVTGGRVGGLPPRLRDLAPGPRRALGALACVAALAALAPQWTGYAAERRLRRAVTAMRTAGAEPSPRLEGVIGEARSLASALPHDARPWRLAGAAQLLSRRPQEALESYRRANALGERAENDLNLGRAFALLDLRPAALAAFVRAAWIAPHLVPEMPAAAHELVRAEVARLEGLLGEGRLAAPPPPPSSAGPPAAAQTAARRR